MSEINETEPAAEANKTPWFKKKAILIPGIIGILIIGSAISQSASGPANQSNNSSDSMMSEEPEATMEPEVTEEPVVVPEVTEEPVPEPEVTEEPEPEGPVETLSQSNAVSTAYDYIEYSSFSRSGLIDQLKYEGYSNADATYAVDTIEVDWNEQAAKTAQSYLDTSSFSRSGLLDQLIYEGFTQSQANYGLSAVGY